MPTCPPPPGSSVTAQRRSRSQAGPLASWGQGRLHEHQPKLKCLFLPPPARLLQPPHPVPAHPPPSTPWPTSAAPSAPREAQRCQEALRESRGAAGVRSASGPTDPPSARRPQGDRPPSWGPPSVRAFPRTGSRFHPAVPMNFRVRVQPDLSALPSLPLGYKWVASGGRGTQLSEGLALGWEYLSPRPVPERAPS